MKKRIWARVLSLSLCLLLIALPVPARAAVTGSYQEGFAKVEQDGLWGFAGPGGKVAIEPVYRSASPFTLGLSTVDLNGKLGVIRPDGSFVIPAEYDALQSLDYGLFIARKGDKWGVISILPAAGAGGQETREIYPLEYARAVREVSGGVDALVLTAADGSKTVIPLFRLPSILSDMGVEGSQFLLTAGKLPAFSDVSSAAWYSLWVDIAYNTGIMTGTGGNVFEPGKHLTVAECLQMAANMDSRFRGDNFHTTAFKTAPWYQPAVDYCLAGGITSEGQFTDYERTITRREMALIFGSTHLARSLPNRNNLTRVVASVHDVSPLESGSSLIYSLYAKGILTGVDRDLSFRPSAPVTRAEAAALGARLARPEQQVDLF